MLKNLLIRIIDVYRIFSRFLFPYPVCRFEPTCSHYAVEAIYKHGAIKGAAMAMLRLLKCNPFFKGGYDPVK